MVVLLSTYEMGRPAFAVASAAAWLREAGHDAQAVDLSRTALSPSLIDAASLFAVHVPMHAATRLAGPVLSRLRDVRPDAMRAAFGLYAPLNESWLRAQGATHVLGPEAEAALVDLATGDGRQPSLPVGASLPRLAFRVPDRSSQPPLTSYARLNVAGARRLAGYTEATRGCLHSCAHCPIVPVYQGALRVVPVEIVLADVDQQVAAGAQHITFGDPDFFNGPTHARRIVDALARRHPGVTYDVTIKVEHLLAHADLLDVLAATSCAFVTSAVEAFDDVVLAHLRKGHTADDARRAVDACRSRGLALAPTFVAFTPWTTTAGYVAFLEELRALDLIDAVPSVQLALRLLLPAGSPLLGDDEIRQVAAEFDPEALAHPWRHPEAAVDTLQDRVMSWLAGPGRRASRRACYAAAHRMAVESAAMSVVPFAPGEIDVRATVPYLDEPWYC